MSRLSGASPRERSAFVIAPEPPYPAASGGAIRTASILEYLRPRYQVDVVTFRESGTATPVFPPDIRVHVIELPFHSKWMPARAGRNLARALRGVPPLVDRFSGFGDEIRGALAGRSFDIGLVEHFWCAPYAAVLRPACRRLILDLHNIESVLLARQSQVADGPVRHIASRFAECCRAMEQRWMPEFDEVLVTSPADRHHAPGARVYPNAIPLVPLPASGKADEIAFSGNLEYEPNQTGVRWFVRSVWPQLRRRRPSLALRLIGRNHKTLQRSLPSDEAIVFSGPVEDAVAELARARVAIVPLLSGSGTRVKIIEAWAAGLAVVSTRIGAEGLPAVDNRDLLVADSADAFVSAVERVLASEELQRQLGSAGRNLYESELSWPVAWKLLQQMGI